MQSPTDSLIEVILNTFVGYVVAVIMWHYLAIFMGIPLTTGGNILIVGCFTVTSIIRQYVLRRVFNGRSMWLTIKEAWGQLLAKRPFVDTRLEASVYTDHGEYTCKNCRFDPMLNCPVCRYGAPDRSIEEIVRAHAH